MPEKQLEEKIMNASTKMTKKIYNERGSDSPFSDFLKEIEKISLKLTGGKFALGRDAMDDKMSYVFPPQTPKEIATVILECEYGFSVK